VQNNNYDKDGETVYTMAFIAEEIDYLDTKAEGEAIRAKQGSAPDDSAPVPSAKPSARTRAAKPVRSRKTAEETHAAVEAGEIPF
ncbi:MAG: hypothetical protein QFE16_03780, partial [Pseudomonadota bacterium]|nr:hypothetical protein [Pseudomonadota bacterium]